MATFVYTIKEQRTITSLVGKVRLLFRLFLLLFAISMIGLGFLLITSNEAIDSIETIIFGLLIGALGGGFPLTLKIQKLVLIKFKEIVIRIDDIVSINYKRKIRRSSSRSRSRKLSRSVIITTREEEFEVYSEDFNATWVFALALGQKLNKTVIDETTDPDREVTPEELTKNYWDTIEQTMEPLNIPENINFSERDNKTTIIFDIRLATIDLLFSIRSSMQVIFTLAFGIAFFYFIVIIIHPPPIVVVIIGVPSGLLYLWFLFASLIPWSKAFIKIQDKKLIIGQRLSFFNFFIKNIDVDDVFVLEHSDPMGNVVRISIRTHDQAFEFGFFRSMRNASEFLDFLHQKIFRILT
ncbi:MAG: hypothetical protein ACXAEU_22195 [Candidatus Hodarchaeales archaeon]|jgi:hypothetical protein